MFNQTWKKYLPVISILLKRSANGEQTMTLNHTDFERASGGRKMKWSFPVMLISNGRIQNNGTKYSAMATEMVAEMQADEQLMTLLKKQDFEFSMSNDFKLLIKNTAINPVPAENEPAPVEIEATVEDPVIEEQVVEENNEEVPEKEGKE